MNLLKIVFLGILSLAQSSFAGDLDFLYGRWEGFGKKLEGKEKKVWVDRISTECNYPAMGGIGVIQAKYVEKLSLKVLTEHGTITPKSVSNEYDFRMTRQDGSILEAGALIKNNTATLAFDLPTATPGQVIAVKYITAVNNDKWFEEGFVSTDGKKTWIKIYEMNLRKVSNFCIKL